MKNSSHACKPWWKKQEGWGPTEIWTRVAGFTSSETQGQSVGSAKVFKHGRNSPWARSIQPKFQPVLVHFKRWTRFFETFPVGPNRSNEFWTEISWNFGWVDSAPWVTDHFKTVKRMLAPDWAKNALCYCAKSTISISRVLFVCSYTTAIVSHTCPVRSSRLCVQFARETFTF